MTDATASAAAAQQTPQATWPAPYLRVAAIMGGWTTLHLAVVAGLAHPLVPGGWWTALAVWLALGAGLAALLRSFREEAYPGKLQRLFVLRPFWYAQAVLLPASLAGAAGWLVGLPFGRALVFGQVAVLGMGALMVALFVAGYVGSHALVVRRVELRFPDLPPAFDGLRIAQLSDLHVGPHTSAWFLRRVARAVERERPDLVAHTGDQVDDYDRDVARFADAFGKLHAPLGTFAIAGNHDVYAGWAGVRAGMEAAGMRVLVNDAVPLQRGGDTLWVAGTGDPAARATWVAPAPGVAPDIERTLAPIPAGAFVVALAHNPALWPALARRGVHLTLSGHTHHGQLSIPFLRWSLASPFLRYSMGLYEEGASRLYVSPGTNYWALPMRVGAWPEVTVLTLRRS